jgi:hypothetical protein
MGATIVACTLTAPPLLVLLGLLWLLLLASTSQLLLVVGLSMSRPLLPLAALLKLSVDLLTHSRVPLLKGHILFVSRLNPEVGQRINVSVVDGLQ